MGRFLVASSVRSDGAVLMTFDPTAAVIVSTPQDLALIDAERAIADVLLDAGYTYSSSVLPATSAPIDIARGGVRRPVVLVGPWA